MANLMARENKELVARSYERGWKAGYAAACQEVKAVLPKRSAKATANIWAVIDRGLSAHDS